VSMLYFIFLRSVARQTNLANFDKTNK